MFYILTKSSELQAYLDNQEIATVMLRTGDFYIKPSTRFRFKLIGQNPIDTRVYTETPLQASYFSSLRDLKIIPTGDFAALELFRCSYAHFEDVWFESAFQVKRGGFIETYENIERQGVGVTTTDENNGDDTYNVTFRHCMFAALKTGVDLIKPKEKGTTRMLFDDCTWDACEYNFRGVRMDDCKIYSGLMQLAYLSLDVDGNNNRIRDLHFERNLQNWRVSAASHYNLLDTDSLLRLTEDLGYQTEVTNRPRRNIEKKDLG